MPTDPRVEALKDAPLDSWIAFAEDESRIVAVGSSFEDVAAKAREEGIADPLIVKTPPDWTPMIL